MFNVPTYVKTDSVSIANKVPMLTNFYVFITLPVSAKC